MNFHTVSSDCRSASLGFILIWTFGLTVQSRHDNLPTFGFIGVLLFRSGFPLRVSHWPQAWNLVPAALLFADLLCPLWAHTRNECTDAWRLKVFTREDNYTISYKIFIWWLKTWYINSVEYEKQDAINRAIIDYFKKARETLHITFITPTVYE